MNKKNLIKLGTVIIIIAIIFMQTYKIQATGSGYDFSSIANSQIGDENGVTSGLNGVQQNNANNVSNNTANSVANNVAKNTANNVAKNNNNKTGALPQTGTNENIIIMLIVVFVGIGIYTFKKVRDYNI